MSKPWIHAKNSVKLFGGVPEDYFEIHHFFDQVKASVSSHSHRMFLHSEFGELLAVQRFGETIKNNDNRYVNVVDIAKQHNSEDLGRTPKAEEYLDCIHTKPNWMIIANCQSSNKKEFEYD